MSEKVSIIVGIYNSADYLKKGLQSIADQTWENIEVLMMNDGSTDDSASICNEFAKNDNRFIAVNKENTGVCDSRNKGLDLATGDYVCFMDGDDWLSNDFVEYMMHLIKQTCTEMALSDVIFTTNDQIQSNNNLIEIWSYETAITKIIYPYMALGPWNKIYSMNLIRKYDIKFPEFWNGETLHFANKVAYYSKKVGVGHRKVYNYRLNNPLSGTTQYNVEYRLLSLKNVKALYKCCFANTNKIKNAIKWHLFTNYYNVVVHIIATKSKKKYISEYREAITFLHGNWLDVFLKSELKVREKIMVLLRAFFPCQLAHLSIWKHNKRHSH